MPQVHRITTDRIITGPEVIETDMTSAISRVIGYVAAVVELALLFRFLFLLFAANTANGFVSFVFDLTNPLVTPFQNVFANVHQGLVVVDWATLLAMVVYGLLAYLVAWLVYFVFGQTDIVDEQL